MTPESTQLPASHYQKDSLLQLFILSHNLFNRYDFYTPSIFIFCFQFHLKLLLGFFKGCSLPFLVGSFLGLFFSFIRILMRLLFLVFQVHFCSDYESILGLLGCCFFGKLIFSLTRQLFLPFIYFIFWGLTRSSYLVTSGQYSAWFSWVKIDCELRENLFARSYSFFVSFLNRGKNTEELFFLVMSSHKFIVVILRNSVITRFSLKRETFFDSINIVIDWELIGFMTCVGISLRNSIDVESSLYKLQFIFIVNATKTLNIFLISKTYLNILSLFLNDFLTEIAVFFWRFILIFIIFFTFPLSFLHLNLSEIISI